jgi:hypothetical protein
MIPVNQARLWRAAFPFFAIYELLNGEEFANKQ